MPGKSAILILCLLALASAQVIDPVARAQARLELIERQVNAGVLPKIRLEQAREELEDAKDLVILYPLRPSIHGRDISIENTQQIIDAAERRVKRKEKQQARMDDLLKRGIVAKAELDAFAQETDQARKDLASAQDWAGKVMEHLKAMAQAEQDAEKLAELAETLKSQGKRPPVEFSTGNGQFGPAIVARIQADYKKRFGADLPISANGESAVHRTLGFDHRGRVDVPLSPDSAEGAWLVRYLSDNRIPFLAFRSAVPGQATGAHVHMGPPSTHCDPDKCPEATS